MIRSVVNIFKRLFRYLGKRLPTAVKRVVVLSSITRMLAVEDTGDYIRRLNTLIINANEEDTVRFGRIIAKWIWDMGTMKLDPGEQIDSRALVGHISDVFRYADEKTMADDLNKVIEFSRGYQQPA